MTRTATPLAKAFGLCFGALECAIDCHREGQVGERTSLCPPDEGRADTPESVAGGIAMVCPHVYAARLTAVEVVCAGEGRELRICPRGFIGGVLTGASAV